MTASVDGESAPPCLLTDDQLRERLAALTGLAPGELETILSNLSVGRGEHRLRFPSEHWPEAWGTREQFLDFWCASRQPR